MKVLGFDPSSNDAAWCLVEVPSFGRPRWIAHEMTDASQGAIDSLFALHVPELVVVELPSRIHPTRDGNPPLSLVNQILKMDRLGNAILNLAARRGLAHVSVSAPEARRYLGVGSSPKDAEIARAVRARLKAVPRCQNHHRDACAAAMFGAAKWRFESATARRERV